MTYSDRELELATCLTRAAVALERGTRWGLSCRVPRPWTAVRANDLLACRPRSRLEGLERLNICVFLLVKHFVPNGANNIVQKESW